MTPLLSSALLRAQTDERLVELAATGHDRAFEAIVERYRRPLLRYLRRLLSDALAEDVVQATFINAWSSLRAGTEVRDLRPWLYRIAHNAAINSLKKVGEAMEEVPESAGGFATEPAAELERRDEMQRALTSIAALPSRQRTALLAVAVDGRAHSDVARELGLTDGAVRQLVHRARTTLRHGATAITPLPLLHAVVASAGDSTVARVAEVAAGAGGAGAASVSLKAGAAAVLATGAIVTGGPQIDKVVHPSQRVPEPAAATPASSGPSTSAGPSTPAVAAPTPTTDHATTTSTTSGRTHHQRRRGRDADDGSSSGSGKHKSGDRSERRRSNSGRSTTSGNRRGSTSSGSGHSGSGSGGSGEGGKQDGASGKQRTTTQAAETPKGGGGGSGDEDLVATPPTTSGGSSGSGGSGGGSGGGGHADAPTQSTPPAVTSAPTPTTPSSGGGEVRTEESSGSGGSGGSG